jgi:4-amino-4-deoxy-L-arabinose transferase-like glycosyltransferase
MDFDTLASGSGLAPGNRRLITGESSDSRRTLLTLLLLLASMNVLLRTLFNNRYGFHRDELLSMDNAHHLAWGYVVYPPVTALLARIELIFFGPSLRGFRFLPAVAQGLIMLLTGLCARELGGKREAQLLGAVAIGISGYALFSGSFLSYSSFDYLWWVLAAYFVIRLLGSNDPRWWICIGATVGIGLMTKYTVCFFILGIAGGVVLTPARRCLKNPWLWLGVALALLIVMPNLF